MEHPGGLELFDNPEDSAGITSVTHSVMTVSEAYSELDRGVDCHFKSEKAYAEWFIEEPLKMFIPYVADGARLLWAEREYKLSHSGMRIDVFAIAENKQVFGFELKTQNKRSPQTHTHQVVLGVGQALLYQDIIRERFGQNATVYLTSDKITSRVAGIIMRHNHFIGLLQSNHRGSCALLGQTRRKMMAKMGRPRN
jgi:hypothetical protein